MQGLYRVVAADTRELMTTWMIESQPVALGHFFVLANEDTEYVFEIVGIDEANKEIAVWPRSQMAD